MGNFLDGEINGFCIVEDKLKACETLGNFKDGLISGFGKFRSKDDEYMYCGPFQNGKFHGTGQEIIRGSSYLGEFRNGRREGIGAYSYNDSNYFGEWKSGEKEGFGIEKFKGRGIYQGDYSSDCKNGTGRYHDYTDSSNYVGHFKEGLRHGFGHIQYSANSFYVGEWKNDKREGQGLFVEEDGRMYFGNWKRNQRDGKGVMSSPNFTYRGDFSCDRPHGRGIFKGKDDKEERMGTFEHGVLSQVKKDSDIRFANFQELDSYKGYHKTSMDRVSELDRLINRKIKLLEDSRHPFKEELKLKSENLDQLMKELKNRIENVFFTVENKLAKLNKQLSKSKFSHVLGEYHARFGSHIDPQVHHAEPKNQVVSSDRKYNRAYQREVATRTTAKPQVQRESQEEFNLKYQSSSRKRELEDINRRLSTLFEDVFEEQPEQVSNRGPNLDERRRLPPPETAPTPDRRRTEEDATSTTSLEDRYAQQLANIEERERLLFIEKMAVKKQKEEVLMLIDELSALKAKAGVVKSEAQSENLQAEVGGKNDEEHEDKDDQDNHQGFDEGFRNHKQRLDIIQEETNNLINSITYLEPGKSVLPGKNSEYMQSVMISSGQVKKDEWSRYTQKAKIDKVAIALGNEHSKLLYYDKLKELVMSVDNSLYRIKVIPGKTPKVISVNQFEEGTEVIQMFDLKGRFGVITQPTFEVILIDLFDHSYNKFDPFKEGRIDREGVKKLGSCF